MIAIRDFGDLVQGHLNVFVVANDRDAATLWGRTLLDSTPANEDVWAWIAALTDIYPPFTLKPSGFGTASDDTSAESTPKT